MSASVLVVKYILNAVGITIFLTSINKAGAVCSDSSLLNDLPKRSRTYQADGVRGSDPYVSDYYLFPGWYRVVFGGEQWLMPDKNSKPKFKTCGTIQPIYLKEPHPKIDNLTDTSLSLVACELYPFDPCLNTYNINIRKCGDEVQYYLKGTSANSAFCFDPPALQNVADLIADAPSVHLGKLEVSPELRFKNNGTSRVPYLVFECVETGGEDRSGQTLIYTTYWYIDDKLQFAFENDSGLSPLSEDSLLSKSILLGIQVRCGSKIAKNASGLKSALTTSANFFAGISISQNRVTMSKNESVTIQFHPTIPYGCFGGEGTESTAVCKIKVHIIVPSPNTCELADTNRGGNNIVFNDIQAFCGIEIDGCHPDEIPCTKTMQPVSMKITTPFFSNDDPELYSFNLVVQDAGSHTIWKGYNITDIVVIIKKDNKYRSKVCFSHVDPHMYTADGKGYENNDFEGEFILYWNTRYNIMVQERTTGCNSNRAYCTCAVAVRAGGDIFLINLCNSLKFIGMTACKDNGALIIQKNSEFDYEVLTNIGTLIKIRIRPRAGYDELMNIDIIMAPKDYEAIRGLCGTFDSNSGNDFHDRNGNTLQDRGQFIHAWKLGDNDKNYLRPTCKANVTSWVEDGQQLFCHCYCYDGQATRPKIETKAVCSPSQFINCTVPLQKTDNLCEEFTDKCQTSNRKRRSSFTVDPEKEMQRRAALAELRRFVRKKRQSDDQDELSKEDVRKICTDGITSSTAVENYSNLLEGYNYSVIIEHCVFDVFEGQDPGWLEAHVIAMNDAVKVGFKRNAKYTEAHREDLVEFKRKYCPSDCHGNGNCTEEGVCSCGKGYFGPDCGKHITQAPQIEDIEGGGVCDVRIGSECKCFDVQVDALAETFYCRRKTTMVYLNGSSLSTDVEEVDGLYKNFFTGECCFESHRERRSTDIQSYVVFHEFHVSLSNDGSTFGPAETIHIYDSLCQDFFTDINGEATVRLKEETCFINYNCLEDNAVDEDNSCRRCIAKQDRFAWTFDCTEDQKDDAVKTIYIIISSVAVALVLIIVSFIWCCCYFKRRTQKRKLEGNAFSSMAYYKRRGSETLETQRSDDKVDENRLHSNASTYTKLKLGGSQKDSAYEMPDKGGSMHREGEINHTYESVD